MSAAAPAAATLRWDCAQLRWRAAPAGPLTEGWVPCTALLTPGSVELERQLALIAERHRTTRLSVCGSLLLERHAWSLATAGFDALLGEGRVPDLGAANVAVQLDVDGFAGSLLLAEPRLETAPPGEPLAALARGLLDAHLLPLVERLAERGVHRGRRALLCLVADALVAGLAGAAAATGCSIAEASRLGSAVAGLLGAPPGLHPRLLPVEGGLVRKRAVCCLLHTEHAVHCDTCPHLSDAETVRRTREASRR
jgi:hypothetical protein